MTTRGPERGKQFAVIGGMVLLDAILTSATIISFHNNSNAPINGGLLGVDAIAFLTNVGVLYSLTQRGRRGRRITRVWGDDYPGAQNDRSRGSYGGRNDSN